MEVPVRHDETLESHTHGVKERYAAMSVLAKTTQILDLVTSPGRQSTLTEIAEQLHQPRSSVHRLLTELMALGLIMRRSNATFAAGPRLVQWGEAAAHSIDLVEVARPHMEWLRDRLGESVHLYVREREHRICIAAVDGHYELRHFTEVGRPLPLRVGAAGKLLLANADPATRAQEIARSATDSPSPRAPTARELESQLEEIGRTGWATSDGEREEGLVAAAVPITDGLGRVAAALSVSGPSARLSSQKLLFLRPDVVEAARMISQELSRTSQPGREG
jgi:DNA-binding IclR family transcriptional regulator